MTESREADVVELRPPPKNLRCECGGEWWKTDVVISAATFRAIAHIEPIACSSCGESRSWPNDS